LRQGKGEADGEKIYGKKSSKGGKCKDKGK
jgi:hypothetical protein